MDVRSIFPDITAQELEELNARVQHTYALMRENEDGERLSDQELATLFDDRLFEMGIDLLCRLAQQRGTPLPDLIRNVVYFVVLSLRSERAKTMLEEALGGD